MLATPLYYQQTFLFLMPKRVDKEVRIKVDIAETEKEFEVQFHIPGMKKEDINIDLDNNRLTVSGERKLKEEKSEKKGFWGALSAKMGNIICSKRVNLLILLKKYVERSERRSMVSG